MKCISQSNRNQTPRAVAEAISRSTGNGMFDSVYKKAESNSRSMNTWERMQEPFPEFDLNGNVDYTYFDGKRFFLVDDNSTTGRTFNGLAYFIQENGGEVVGCYAITAGNDESEKMTVTNATWEEIERLGVDNVREFAEQNNVKRDISRDGLTEREANELVRQYRKDGGNSDSGVARVGEGLQEVYGRKPGTSGKNRNGETETLNEAPEQGAFLMPENFDRQASIGLSYSDLLSKYGSIPKGEMPRQDVRIPSKLDDFTNISRYARTVMESIDNPEFTAQMKAALEEGLGSYTPYSNAKAIEEAQNRMRSILRKPPRLR